MRHDRFFRTVFSVPERAAALLKPLVPEAVSVAADWGSLARVNASFVNPRLGGSESDLLFSLTCAERPALIYVLLEHQSTVDADMPFRLLSYMVEIWREQVQAAADPIPALIPVVLYQGKGAWTVPRDFGGWLLKRMGMPEVGVSGLGEAIREATPAFSYKLLMLNETDVEAFAEHAAVTAALSLMQAVGRGEVDDWMTEHENLLVELLEAEDTTGFLRVLFTYLFSTGGSENASTMSRTVAKLKHEQLKSQAMSYAEYLINQGKAEGEARGEERGAHIGTVLTYQDLLGESRLTRSILSKWTLEDLAKAAAEFQARFHGRST